MEPAVYHVKTPVFEGPLDLLLSLIEKRKLFINEISLTQVTDDYIAYINTLPKTHMSEIANFIVVAATLILLKSKSLLPSMSLTEEEQTSIEELEARLRMYKRIKEVGEKVKDIFGRQIIFGRPEIGYVEPVFAPGKEITIENIFSLVKEVIGRIPKEEKTPEAIVRKVINIEEMIEKLTDRIQSNLKLSFKEFSEGGTSGSKKEQKMYAIVGFLALLELVRQGIINAIQEGSFGDIEIEQQELQN